jgi:CxxC-x17-CxxC domain-containing protein
MQNVGTVEMIVKYHSNQKKTDLYIAQIPFKPKEDRPVYCKECFQKHKPEPRGGSRFGGRSSYGRSDRGDRGSRFGRRDDRPREMFDAKCGDCGNDCQIPFKPKEDRPVYCRECFQNHRQ